MQGLATAPSTSEKMAHNELSSDSGDKVDGVTEVKLPAQLQKITPATEFVSVRHRWNTNEELASILIAFDRHKEWLLPQKIRPASGSMLLYNRKVVFYRRDGYCWKKRRNGSTIREDHMKLKVQGLECIYGSYVHSAILPTFHRRCYWLLQNPNIVLIHYLNVPYPEAAKPSICELSSNQWSKEQLVDQLRPMLSKVSEGMERNIDEDKRVEKMLEEILQILMPLQDGRVAKPLINKEKMLAVKQFGSSSSNTTQQQVIHPNHRVIMTCPPQPIQLKPVQPGVATPSSTSPGIVGTSNGIGRISQVFGVLPSVTSTSTSSNTNGSSNGIGQIGQVFGVLPSGLLTCDQSSISNGNATQLMTLGNPNQLVRNTPAVASTTECTMEASEGRDEDMKEVKNSLEENRSAQFQKGASTYNDHGCGVLGSLNFVSQPNGIALNQSVLTTRVVHPSPASANVTESRSHTHGNPIPSFHIPLNQESLSSNQPSKYSQRSQPSQQQQVVINSIAQNHSVQNAPGPSPPVLTLHLKPTTGSSTESPGFVLSLQGATIVSQHSSMPVTLSGSGGTANCSPSSNSSCGNTSLVLVASQNNSGAELSIRQPVCFSQGTNMAAPGAPNDYTVTQQFTAQGSHAHSAFSLPGNRINLDPFNSNSKNICSTQNSTASCIQNSHTWSLIANSSQHQNTIINNSLSSLGQGTHTPQHFSSAKNNSQDLGYGVGATSSHLYPNSNLGSAGNCTNMSGLQPSTLTHQSISPLPNPFICSSPTTAVANPSNLNHQRHITPFQQRQQQRFETISPPTPPVTASSTSSKDSANPFLASVSDGHLFKFDSNSASQFTPISNVTVRENKSQYPNTHHNSSDQVLASLSSDQENNVNPQVMMAGPSGLNSMDKEMITNSNSCDTLDGSFSSLPSADLNLDDLLDLNDLDDVSDLGSSPFTPPNISLQILDKSCMDHQPIVTTHNGDFSDSVPQGSATSCLRNASQLQQQQHLQHHQFNLNLAVPEHGQKQIHVGQQAPTSPLHPGAPPRPHNILTCQPMTSTSSVFSCDNAHPVSSVGPKTSSVIKDFSPDWAYINTNTKVLVAGPWQCENSCYTCVFDGEHIPAILIQAGLLRCYAQYHTPGYATLQVARDGIIISNCEVFTFCDKEKSNNNADNHPEWFDFDVNQLKLLLVERLNQLCRLFINIQPLNRGTLCSADLVTLEQKLIEQIEVLSGQEVCDAQTLPKAGQHNLTLLHLAAGLGLTKLVACLIRCRMVNKCMALEFDVDAQSVDSHSCTPMTWACAHGHTATVLTLYHWNSAPLKMCNRDGLLPLALARQRGHHNLASQVEQLEQAKEGENRQQGTMDVSCCHALTPGTEAPSSISSNCSSTGFLDPAAKDENRISEKDSSKMNEDEEDEQCAEAPTRERQMQPPDVTLFSRPCKPGPKLIRRFSEQVLVPQSRPLSKRNSVDLLPSGQSLDQPSHPGIASPAPLASQSLSPSASPSSPSLAGSLLTPGSCGEASMGSAQDGDLGSAVQPLSEEDRACSPDLTDVAFVVPPAPRLTLEEKLDEPSGYRGHDEEEEEEEAVEETTEAGSASRMDTDEIITHSTDSPLIDVERISSDDEREVEPSKDGSKHQMVTLANQIIAAIPERIKLSPAKDELDEASSSGRGRAESHSSIPSQGGSPRPSSFDDSGISTPMTDSLAFDEYRYPELGTPSSSLSPESTCLPSPYSPYSFTLDSPPPTTAEFTEYFNAPTTYMEKDFSQLTLSDQEQRKLYEAAKVIQNAYRHYRDKQQQKEIEAAILIQSYYRRYKTYAYYKKMSQAAVLIQNQFRTYYARRKKRGDLSSVNRRESERLKKGRNQSVIIQQRFRSHYQRRSFEGKDGAGPSTGSGDGPERALQARPLLEEATESI